MKIIDFDSIRQLNLSPEEMYNWTSTVWKEQDEHILVAKTSMWQGESGRYMTMPCVLPKYDIAGVKFICRNVDDAEGLPVRNSNIMLQNISKHGLLCVMDGTYITTMRTGACAAYNALNFAKTNPHSIAIYGLGLTARSFMLFYAAKLSQPITVKLLRYKNQAELFIDRFKGYGNLKFEIVENLAELFNSDIIVSCVSFAHQILAPENTYPKGVTIIPVHTAGFQNCDLAFDRVIVDDVNHVMKYRYFNEFKNKMVRITDVANGRAAGRLNDEERIVVYNGGIALTDMYWAMKIAEKFPDTENISMSYPEERFWI